MALVTTEAIVLHAFAYGDTSRILRLLTRDHGVQSVIARGALRPRSRFGAVLEPFTEGAATFLYRTSRDLHTLTGFELSWSAQRIGADLVRFGGASLLAEIVLRTASEEADSALFEGLSAALHRLADAPRTTVETTVLAECWALVDRLGFAPALDSCVACGRSIDPTADTTFDYTAGGVRCPACAAHAAGRPLPADARATLAALAAGRPVAIPRTAPHWRLLARYLAHHVVGEPPLRSLAFLAGLVGSATEIAGDASQNAAGGASHNAGRASQSAGADRSQKNAGGAGPRQDRSGHGGDGAAPDETGHTTSPLGRADPPPG